MAEIKITDDGKCKSTSFEAEYAIEPSCGGAFGTLTAHACGDCESEAKLYVLDALRDMRDQLNATIAAVEAWRDARTAEDIAKEQAEVQERYRRRYGCY